MPVGSGGSEPGRRNHPTAKIQDADVLLLPASLLPTLPLPCTLVCLQTYSSLPVHVAMATTVCEALKRLRRVVFGSLEWLALVSAFENERANPISFHEWCESKRKSPTWKVTHADTIGRIGDLRPPSCSEGALLGAVLRGWGLHLQRVHYGAEVLR